jgi:hypothetical protein
LACDTLWRGGGGRTWNFIDGRPEMAADLADWVRRSVEMAADYGVGGQWDAALSAVDGPPVSDLARQATRDLVAAAAAGDADTVQRIAEQIQAEGLTAGVWRAFGGACAYVATRFRDRWGPPADDDPQAAAALASVLREIDKWEGRLALLFRPAAPPVVQTVGAPAPPEPPPPSAAPPELLPDGPFDPDGFRYRGTEVRFGRAGKQRGLVLALWDQKERRPRPARPIQDVITEVYGENNDTSGPAFRQLCSDAQKKLNADNVPLKIESLQGKVQLTPRPL